MKKYTHITVTTLLFLTLFVASSNASTILGFTSSSVNSSSNFTISDIAGTTSLLDFGHLSVTIAKNSGTDVSQMLGAQVIMSSVEIDETSKSLVTSLGGFNIYSYSIDTPTIMNGFQVKLQGNIVLEADLTLTELVTTGKCGSIDSGFSVNLTDVQVFTSGLDATVTAFLESFLPGGDLTIGLVSYSELFEDAIGVEDIEGAVNGEMQPVPEPMAFLFMGWGMAFLYYFRKVSYLIKK